MPEQAPAAQAGPVHTARIPHLLAYLEGEGAG